MTVQLTAHTASSEAFQLGEGPVWDAERGRVLWVDILSNRAYEGELLDGLVTVSRIHQFDEMACVIVPTDDNGLLVATQTSLVTIDRDGSRHQGPRVVPEGTASRSNDGAVDPAGRFIVGTLSLAANGGNNEQLLRLEGDGSWSTLDDDLGLSNGLAWSRGGSLFYSVDTATQTVWVRTYDAASGQVGPREAHLRFTEGWPDGICVDAEDHLWVAMWGLGEVRRYSPEKTLTMVVSTTAPNTSSVAFVGPELNTLLITTARSELSDADLPEHPQSGHLFTVQPGVKGLPTPPWRSVPFRE